jgi:hypothetical protein
VQIKYDKRLEKISAKRARAEEKARAADAKRAAQGARKAEMDARRREKEAIKGLQAQDIKRQAAQLQRIKEDMAAKGIAMAEADLAAERRRLEDQQRARQAQQDESLVVLASGPFAGRLARNVPLPPGSAAVVPPAAIAPDLLPVYTFLHDLAGPLGAQRLSFDQVRRRSPEPPPAPPADPRTATLDVASAAPSLLLPLPMSLLYTPSVATPSVDPRCGPRAPLVLPPLPLPPASRAPSASRRVDPAGQRPPRGAASRRFHPQLTSRS